MSFIAHRGCTDSAPENTVASFMDAVEKGFKSIEMDICTLKDGSLICSHNFDLEKESMDLESKSIDMERKLIDLHKESNYLGRSQLIWKGN